MNKERLEEIRKETREKGLISSWSVRELLDHIDRLQARLDIAPDKKDGTHPWSETIRGEE